MSLHAMTWVLDHSAAEGGPRLVLLALAEHAHDDGSEAYPSVETLARRARLSRRGVQYALRKLEADGHVSADGISRKGTTIWRIHMGAQDVRPSEEGGRNLRHEGGATASPEPTTEPSPSMSSPAREAVRFNGAIVDPYILRDAESALAYYGERTGQLVYAINGRDKPTESFKRIIGAMITHPSVRTNYRRVIDATLESAWWGDGPASVGAVFGPNIIEQNIARASAPPAIGSSRGRNGKSRLVRPSDVAHLFPRSQKGTA